MSDSDEYDSDNYDDEFNFTTRDLTSLPELPDDLEELQCSQNRLTELPEELPYELKTLECEENMLTSLPDLPPNLEVIFGILNRQFNNIIPKIMFIKFL